MIDDPGPISNARRALGNSATLHYMESQHSVCLGRDDRQWPLSHLTGIVFQSQEHNVPIYYPPKAIANHTKTKRVDKGENLSDFHRGPPSPPTSPKENLLISGRDRQPTNSQSCIRSTSLWGSRGLFFFKKKDDIPSRLGR